MRHTAPSGLAVAELGMLQSLVKQSQNAHEIVPGIWLGNRGAALDPNFLRTHNIRAVFNCTKDIPFHETVNRRYRVPVDDNLQPDEIRNLELWSYEIVYKMSMEHKRAISKGEGVLVHCAAGMQRSAASVAMYLIATNNVTTDQAIAYIQNKRAIAFRPSANFEPAMRSFEASFNQNVRPQLTDPAAKSPAA
jgi:protein-tyrosine phosphatase